MSVVFREPFPATAPGGYVIGLVGDDGAGKRDLLELAAGLRQASPDAVTASPPRRYLGPSDTAGIGDAMTLAMYHTLATKDAATRARTAMDLELLRRRGGAALLVSHEPDLLAWLSDEIWWIDQGRLKQKGDPREVLDAYRRHVAARLREQANGSSLMLTPTMRKGDGRAVLESVETLDESGRPVAVWQTGAMVGVRVVVRFERWVADPVVGILIRTRIGFEVFGTNTELEKVKLGPCQASDALGITFRFPCHLCPQEYTLTAASHDPDGVWHDWMEDGLAFSVVDHRYTAGVACLRAHIEVQKLTK
ncbi:MAG: Wzt carbohydrate-binding domain-containing protein [Acidobacteria bacterium]|nr:Wzt carbohydrate-binding domain-containing protein [Acidobacteriota bacterium]